MSDKMSDKLQFVDVTEYNNFNFQVHLRNRVLYRLVPRLIRSLTFSQSRQTKVRRTFLVVCNTRARVSTDEASSRDGEFCPANTYRRVSSSPATSCKPRATSWY